MICFANDYEVSEEDKEGDFWTYCERCDCWTSHPPLKYTHTQLLLPITSQNLISPLSS